MQGKLKRCHALLQEPGARQVITFPRQLGNSVRKPDERRKRAREAHEQNKKAVKEQAEVETKRLKNLKKQELQDRLVTPFSVCKTWLTHPPPPSSAGQYIINCTRFHLVNFANSKVDEGRQYSGT